MGELFDVVTRRVPRDEREQWNYDHPHTSAATAAVGYFFVMLIMVMITGRHDLTVALLIGTPIFLVASAAVYFAFLTIIKRKARRRNSD